MTTDVVAQQQQKTTSLPNSIGSGNVVQDPLPPIELKRLTFVQRYNMQSAAALAGFIVMGGLGLGLTIHSELKKGEDSDVFDTIGSLVTEGGFSCILVAIWQLMNSQEYAYRASKWFGLVASIALFIVGLLLQFLLGKEPPGLESILGTLMLSQAIGPAITTLLLLEPKEKETLAMPYVNNFCKFVAEELAKKDHILIIVVPSHFSLCSAIHDRLKQYKDHGFFGEEQLQCGGFKKFSTCTRKIAAMTDQDEEKDEMVAETYYFDIPTFLSNATPNKLGLFKETLKAYLKELGKKGQLKNVVVTSVANLTLKDIDASLIEALKKYNNKTSSKV